MTRIDVYKTDQVTGERTLDGWFDIGSAVVFYEATREDGTHTNSAGNHEDLFLTSNGRWVLGTWSDRPDSQHNHQYITADTARAWLIRNDYEAKAKELFGHAGDEQESGERKPGRPEIGPPINIRFGTDLLSRVDEKAAAAGTTRADMLRWLVDAGANTDGAYHLSPGPGTFLAALGISELHSWDPTALWSQTEDRDTDLTVPIGISASATAIGVTHLNLTTVPIGSVQAWPHRDRTSELLTVLTLGLCARYSPRRLQILLATDKSGPELDIESALPHVKVLERQDWTTEVVPPDAVAELYREDPILGGDDPADMAEETVVRLIAPRTVQAVTDTVTEEILRREALDPAALADEPDLLVIVEITRSSESGFKLAGNLRTAGSRLKMHALLLTTQMTADLRWGYRIDLPTRATTPAWGRGPLPAASSGDEAALGGAIAAFTGVAVEPGDANFLRVFRPRPTPDYRVGTPQQSWREVLADRIRAAAASLPPAPTARTDSRRGDDLARRDQPRAAGGPGALVTQLTAFIEALCWTRSPRKLRVLLAGDVSDSRWGSVAALPHVTIVDRIPGAGESTWSADIAIIERVRAEIQRREALDAAARAEEPDLIVVFYQFRCTQGLFSYFEALRGGPEVNVRPYFIG